MIRQTNSMFVHDKPSARDPLPPWQFQPTYHEKKQQKLLFYRLMMIHFYYFNDNNNITCYYDSKHGMPTKHKWQCVNQQNVNYLLRHYTILKIPLKIRVHGLTCNVSDGYLWQLFDTDIHRYDRVFRVSSTNRMLTFPYSI